MSFDTPIPNRIYFKDNPWPEGHPIKDFKFSGEYHATSGFRLHLHLRSEDYYAERDIEDDPDCPSDWDAPIVWGNYHNVILSSTFWGHKGLVLTPTNQFERADLARRFEADNVNGDTLTNAPNMDYDEMCFGIYLLGHDTAANHVINITANKKDNFDISWEGQIALTYIGHEDLKHRFKAVIQNITFAGFDLPAENTETHKAEILKHLAQPNDWRFETWVERKIDHAAFQKAQAQNKNVDAEDFKFDVERIKLTLA